MCMGLFGGNTLTPFLRLHVSTLCLIPTFIICTMQARHPHHAWPGWWLIKMFGLCACLLACLFAPCRLGIRITRGQIKLFADFLQSDIIIASPVALATKLAEDAAAAAERAAAGSSRGPGSRGRGRGGRHAAAAATGAGGSGGGGEADFLSSIEVCVVERADVMLMQNWQHVVTGESADVCMWCVCAEHDTIKVM
jgi:uncharacterized membrane protein YgcG